MASFWKAWKTVGEYCRKGSRERSRAYVRRLEVSSEAGPFPHPYLISSLHPTLTVFVPVPSVRSYSHIRIHVLPIGQWNNGCKSIDKFYVHKPGISFFFCFFLSLAPVKGGNSNRSLTTSCSQSIHFYFNKNYTALPLIRIFSYLGLNGLFSLLKSYLAFLHLKRFYFYQFYKCWQLKQPQL